ncbi:hypothetical protein [Pararhodobacter aggregans]|uniref:hypothetical protein n=1 Tax=Pararhodobacter aggregans TaxID=404875 RepID=UPI003A8C99BE
MEYLSDLLLTAASMGAATYCVILSRRLKALGSLEGGMGSAIAVLSAQVDDLARSLRSAQEATGRAGGRLDGQTARAEAVARKLELLVASMHDLPEDAPPAPRAPSPRPPTPWPGETLRRSIHPVEALAEDPADDPAEPPQRARVLRRRQTSGAL